MRSRIIDLGEIMNRVILHCDANSFYASVFCSIYPLYRGLPVAICGDPEARHGIVLAATREAKKMGVKVGMAVWQARQCCPRLIVQPPDYNEYIRYSRHMRSIYEEFTPLVESFGLDECWLDISNPGVTIEDGKRLADKLRHRIVSELGITVSVGVSDNKIFAKLGSDIKKPDATTVITKENYQKLVWPLPVGDLLYVGPQTEKKLLSLNVTTIGQLANYPAEILSYKFGKNGLTLQAFANGLDCSPVMNIDERVAIKSVGNSATLPHDVTSVEAASAAIFMLSESVAARMRESGLRGRCISISVRDTKLNVAGCQHTIGHSTALAGEIARTAIGLFKQRYMGMLPLRSMGVNCSSLVPDNAPVQTDLFGQVIRREKEHDLAKALDDIRRRWGHNVIQRGVVMTDSAFAAINPVADHTIHPVSFFNGGK